MLQTLNNTNTNNQNRPNFENLGKKPTVNSEYCLTPIKHQGLDRIAPFVPIIYTAHTRVMFLHYTNTDFREGSN